MRQAAARERAARRRPFPPAGCHRPPVSLRGLRESFENRGVATGGAGSARTHGLLRGRPASILEGRVKE
ncbi:MAG: hypothetical protein Q613_PSC00316G0002, partial [Propionibacterium sp. DORA_15]